MDGDILNKVKAELLNSYTKGGGVNHIGGPSLPSRESIKSIIHNIESLLFPGYQSDENIDECILYFRTSEKLNLLYKDLYNELKRASCYKLELHSKCAHSCTNCSENSKGLSNAFINRLTAIRDILLLDAEAALAGDPAATSMEDIILSYPGFKALTIHRIAHEFYLMGVPLIPRMMSEYAHETTGIDIHPGASIGNSFFIDHGTGVVIGETTIIGDNVKIYQGVTLGALSVKKDEANIKRHPTIENNVTIYAGATILGGDTVVGEDSIIGGNVWIVKSVDKGSKIYNKPIDYSIKS